MYYEAAANIIKEVLTEQNIDLKPSFEKNFLSVISEMCNYSEEDHKIRPQIILGRDLDEYFETITAKNYFIMYEDTLEGEKFPRYFKSLALFCENGWYIVVNQKENSLEYGIFRRYTNIDGDTFENFFKESFGIIPNGNMVIVKAKSNFEILIVCHDSDDKVISQRFVNSEFKEDEAIFLQMVDDIIVDIEDEEYVKKCMLKVIRNFPMKLHGTILLVVEDDFVLPEESLSGIKIMPPINFAEIFLNYVRVEEYSEAEYVYSLTGAFYEMLNTDGITVITNKGRLLYYNVFYEGNIPKDIKGGARKRTAMGIYENEKLDGIRAVYFQSQDGDILYKRKGTPK